MQTPRLEKMRRGVLTLFLVDYDSSSIGNVVVHEPNIIIIHPQTTVADGEADAGVIITVRVHRPVFQTGVEGIARGTVETNDGTAVVRAVVPGRLLIRSGEHASNGWRRALPGTAQAGADELPVALRAFKNVHALISQVDPNEILCVALVALKIDPSRLDLFRVVVRLRPSQCVVPGIVAGDGF